MDSVSIGPHGSENIAFEVTPYGITPPFEVPLWAWITSAVLIGAGIAYFVIKK